MEKWDLWTDWDANPDEPQTVIGLGVQLISLRRVNIAGLYYDN